MHVHKSLLDREQEIYDSSIAWAGDKVVVMPFEAQF
jgi:hypothetical protein